MHVSKNNVLDVVGASHLQRVHQHTAQARLSNMGIFSKNTGSKEHLFVSRPFAPFRARFAEFRARFAPLFREKKMLSSTSCPKS